MNTSFNIETVFLTATNEGSLYEYFKRIAWETQNIERVAIGDYQHAITLKWYLAVYRAVDAHRKNVNDRRFDLSDNERMTLAFCLAWHYAEHFHETAPPMRGAA